MAIGKNLQKVLIELSLNQSEMAKMLGISRQQFNNIINGRSTFTQKSIDILHNKFNVNLNWLFYNEGSMFLNSDDKNAEILKIKLKRGQLLQIEYED